MLSLLRPIEVVLSSVWNFSHFVRRPGVGGRNTAGRVRPLYVRHFREDAVAARLRLLQQQPGNRA